MSPKGTNLEYIGFLDLNISQVGWTPYNQEFALLLFFSTQHVTNRQQVLIYNIFDFFNFSFFFSMNLIFSIAPRMEPLSHQEICLS